ncbi:hypothetical protein BDW02DRAFT_34285 [Decorospora gaudefroyi]|uniref:Uncharacterized protein n=1 Tax=Decorospora gaudefroyi TaxID=184978 RepID=A0A6A5KIP5_9PLEO|nr:hypothetical protein BDW02DRAFT_34285 [Decorospora gaudefroyi]
MSVPRIRPARLHLQYARKNLPETLSVVRSPLLPSAFRSGKPCSFDTRFLSQGSLSNPEDVCGSLSSSLPASVLTVMIYFPLVRVGQRSGELRVAWTHSHDCHGQGL